MNRTTTHPSNDPNNTMPDVKKTAGKTIRIAATPAEVWRALTDPEALASWFPVKAEIKPGVGGYTRMYWDEKNGFDERIEIWEPERHLRTADDNAGYPGVATDYYLEAEGNTTVLRVVSSGFGEDDRWQDILDSFQLGWNFELEGLKYWLEVHADKPRTVIRASRRNTGDLHDVWTRLTGPGGFLPASGLSDGATPLETAPPFQMVLRTAPDSALGDALLRLQVLTEAVGGDVNIWASCYDIDPASGDRLAAEWQRWLDANVR